MSETSAPQDQDSGEKPVPMLFDGWGFVPIETSDESKLVTPAPRTVNAPA